MLLFFRHHLERRFSLGVLFEMFSVSALCLQIFTVKSTLWPKMAISMVKWIFGFFFIIRPFEKNKQKNNNKKTGMYNVAGYGVRP